MRGCLRTIRPDWTCDSLCNVHSCSWPWRLWTARGNFSTQWTQVTQQEKTLVESPWMNQCVLLTHIWAHAPPFECRDDGCTAKTYNQRLYISWTEEWWPSKHILVLPLPPGVLRWWSRGLQVQHHKHSLYCKQLYAFMCEDIQRYILSRPP